MLAESTHRSKENMPKFDSHAKESSGLLPSTISVLKQQISSLQKEKHSIQRQWLKQVNILKLQINEYKKKLAIVTDKYLVETFTKQKNNSSVNLSKDYESLLRQKQMVNEHEKDHRKKLEQQIRTMAQQNSKLKKEIGLTKLQKQKSMQISLIEKIELQEKNRLLQQQIKSKKSIISSLKKQLDKIYSEKEQINKKERVLEQKTKELDCYSKQINEYNRLNQIRMKQQITQITKQNQFLKDYVKKLQKLAKKDCECEVKEQKVRENLYEIRRQLALAKVKLNQQFQTQGKSKKKIISSQSSDNQSSYSFDQRKK